MSMTTRAWQVLVAATLVSCATPAFAQYKYVGPDGRITYSDTPPPATAKGVEQKPIATAAAGPALPFELQQASTKYPVTLYTGDKCAPCDEARSFLRGRGVPFSERTVTSDEDIALFKQQSPDGTAPVVTVGARKSTGFSRAALASLLDDAGYPATSSLPRDYQNAAPAPLSPNTRAPSSNVAQTPTGTTSPARAPAASINAPGGPAPTTPTTPPAGFRF